MAKERRFKRVHLPEDLFTAILTMPQHQTRLVFLPHLLGLPDDAELENVFHDPYYKNFVAIYYHPSWEIVPDGEQIQGIDLHQYPIQLKFDCYVKIAGPEKMENCQKILKSFMELGKDDGPEVPF